MRSALVTCGASDEATSVREIPRRRAAARHLLGMRVVDRSGDDTSTHWYLPPSCRASSKHLSYGANDMSCRAPDGTRSRKLRRRRTRRRTLVPRTGLVTAPEQTKAHALTFRDRSRCAGSRCLLDTVERPFYTVRTFVRLGCSTSTRPAGGTSVTTTTLRSIALMTILSSSLLVVLLVLASGLDVRFEQLPSRAVPLVLACAAGLTLLVTLGERDA